MKKLIIILLLLQISQSCRRACEGDFRFTNNSAKTVTFTVLSGKFNFQEKSFTVKKGSCVDFDIWYEDDSFNTVPPSTTSITVQLENGKKVVESCSASSREEQRNKCNLTERSFFLSNSYTRFRGRGNQCDGYEYIFTDEDAARAK